MPGSEQTEGLAARSICIIVPMLPQGVNGLSKIIWRAFFVPGRMKEIFEGNCLKDTLTIADSVESGLSALVMPVKAA